MAYEHALQRYRAWYRALVSLYPQPYRERFGEGMQQTFHDLCRERSGSGLSVVVLWLFVDTAAGIIKEHLTSPMNISRTAKFVFGALGLLLIPLAAEVLQNTQTLALSGFDWKPGDFAVMAVLLALFGMSAAYATGPRSAKQRVIGAGLVLLVLATYVHLAVGIVDWLPFAGS